MKMTLRKVLCGVCAWMLVASTVACSSTKKEEAPTTGQQASVQQPKAPDKVVMWVSAHNEPMETVSNSMDIKTIKYMADKTNTILDIQFLDHNKYDDITRMKFASGEKVDIWQAWAYGGRTEIANGLNADLKDLVDKFGPNLKKNIPQIAWDAATVGGKLMCIPAPMEYEAYNSRGFIVRKDWMDKAGVKEFPKTSDELLDMLRKFRDNDPNGNGQKDDIPFSAREKFSWMEGVFNMWGITPGSFGIYDGKAMPGFASKDMKKPLEFTKTMLSEKLIDSEFLTNTSPIWTNKFNSNKVGLIFHMPTQFAVWDNNLKAALPDVKNISLSMMPCPRGKDYSGKLGFLKIPVEMTFFVHKDATVKEAAVRIFDWLATEEGALFGGYGLEGLNYEKLANGNFKYTAEKEKEAKTTWRPLLFKLVELENVSNKIEMDKSNMEKIRSAVKAVSSEGIENPLYAMPVPKAMLSNADLQYSSKSIQEAMSQIIYGEKPLDYWDEVMDKWMKAGGEGIIKEATDWYNKNAKK